MKFLCLALVFSAAARAHEPVPPDATLGDTAGGDDGVFPGLTGLTLKRALHSEIWTDRNRVIRPNDPSCVLFFFFFFFFFLSFISV
jgi:hypothetical protein